MESMNLIFATECNLNSYLKDTIYIPKNSESTSIILDSKLILDVQDQDRMGSKEDRTQSIDIIMKCQPSRNLDSTDNSFRIEIDTYSNIINKLYHGGITPHLVNCIGAFRCSDFLSSIKRWPFKDIEDLALVQKRWRTSSDFEDMECSAFSADVLVLPKSPGVTFQQYMKSIDLKTKRHQDELTTILFQLIYSLHCFVGVGMRHNDLHFGNILIESGSPVTEITYMLDEETIYRVPSHGLMAKIYDFDRASVEGNPKNTGLDSGELCLNFGCCNNKNPVYDIYTLVSNLYFNGLNKYNSIQIKKDFKEVMYANKDTRNLFFVDGPYFPNDRTAMCDLVDLKCNGDYKWEGKELPTPDTFIRTLRTFQIFKIDPLEITKEMLMGPNMMFANEALRNKFKVDAFFLAPTIMDFGHLSEAASYDYVCKCREEEEKGSSSMEICARRIVENLNWISIQIASIPNFDFMKNPQSTFDTYDDFIEVCLAKHKRTGLSLDDRDYKDDAEECFLLNRDAIAGGPVRKRSNPTTFQYLYERGLRKKSIIIYVLALMYTNPRWILLSPQDRFQWFMDQMKNTDSIYSGSLLSYNIYHETIYTVRCILNNDVNYYDRHQKEVLPFIPHDRRPISEDKEQLPFIPDYRLKFVPDRYTEGGIFIVALINKVSTIVRSLKNVEKSESRRLFAMYDDIIRVYSNSPEISHKKDEEGIINDMAIILVKKHYTSTLAIPEPWEWGRYDGHSTFEYLFCCIPEQLFSREDHLELLQKYELTLTLLALMYTDPRWVLFSPLRKALWIRNKILGRREDDTEIDRVSCGPVYIMWICK